MHTDLAMSSSSNASWTELKRLAEHWFEQLKCCQGVLAFHMAESFSDEEEGRKEAFDMEIPSIVLKHLEGIWSIDDEVCIQDPPVLRFGEMSQQVTAIEASFYAPGAPHGAGRYMRVLIDFDSKCEQRVAFAYRGNVGLSKTLCDLQSSA